MANNPRVEARVPEDIYALVNDQCERLNITPSDVIRDALTQYYYEQTQLKGMDAGFKTGQNHIPRLTRAALMYGMRAMPEDLDAAILWASQILAAEPLPFKR